MKFISFFLSYVQSLLVCIFYVHLDVIKGRDSHQCTRQIEREVSGEYAPRLASEIRTVNIASINYEVGNACDNPFSRLQVGPACLPEQDSTRKDLIILLLMTYDVFLDGYGKY